jgi:hypothetical protein
LRPRVSLNRIFISIVVVIKLTFIKSQKDVPEQIGSVLVCQTYHCMNVVDNGVTKRKRQFRFVESVSEIAGYLIIKIFPRHTYCPASLTLT